MPPATYDFRTPLPMPAEATRMVAQVVEAAPRIGLSLTVSSGRDFAAQCPGIERVTGTALSEAGDLWVPLSCGLTEPAILLVPSRLAVALADVFLGGRGMTEDRSASPLEQRLVVRHLLPALEPIRNALAEQRVAAFAPGEPSVEAQPSVGGDTVALRIELTLPEGSTGILTLAFPTRVLLPAAAARAALPPAPSPTATAAFADVAVTLALRLTGAPVTAADVEGLAVGDVLRLANPLDTPVVGLLDDQPFLLAGLGRRGRKRAVVVLELLGA